MRATLLLGVVLALTACEPPPTPPEAPPAPQAASPPPPEAPPAPQTRAVERRIARGDTLLKVLREGGLDHDQANALIDALRPQIDPARHLRAGDALSLTLDADGRPLAMSYHSQRRGAWALTRDGDAWALAPLDSPPPPDPPEPPPPPLPARAEDYREEEDDAQEAPEPLDEQTRQRLDDERERLEALERQRSGRLNRVYTLEPPAEPPKNATQRLIVEYYSTTDEAQRAELARRIAAGSSLEKVRKHIAQAYKPPARKPGIYNRTVQTNAGLARYVVYVPKDYNGRRAMPLHISLHGGGGNGEGNCRIRWGPQPPKGFLLVCPNTPGGAWGTPRGEDTILATYRAVLREFNVNSDQISLGGASNGGNGTWQMAAKHPDLWSALVPRCAVALTPEEQRKNMKHIPVFMLHGAADHQIVVSHSRQMLKDLRALGAKPRYIEEPGVGHDFLTQHNPTVARWMLPHKRKMPKSFTFYKPRGGAPELTYWLSAEGAGDIEASIAQERGLNLVTLKTTREPTLLKIFFARGLADLRKPVRVVLNDKIVFDGVVRGDVRDLLDSFSLTGDLRRVFDASLTLR